MTTIAIYITNTPGGGATVYTSSGQPISSDYHCPAQQLANQLLLHAAQQASDVHYWHGTDNALQLAQRLTNPDEYAYAIHADVFSAAVRVINQHPNTTKRSEGATA